ncbi:hypothetical protein OO006_12885 [Prosthecochloris sp. SCSIO W1101]|uniref:hypothetical protein n=1 Tax=Prosthecochloris sp. SCSIO W1101 TaxID=2992242 RepID=UPI00223D38A2|nr:hypothetical protein [Prosthecochloris sp. SCSIO W1101]UZJ41219.1 hypothetical protein OO006_12885 [Prosthecochloris sp. SCSIO W1101]
MPPREIRTSISRGGIHADFHWKVDPGVKPGDDYISKNLISMNMKRFFSLVIAVTAAFFNRAVFLPHRFSPICKNC